MLCGVLRAQLAPAEALLPDLWTKVLQGWPKLWADFRALLGIFSQSVGPSLAIWANPVQFRSYAAERGALQTTLAQSAALGLGCIVAL